MSLMHAFLLISSRTCLSKADVVANSFERFGGGDDDVAAKAG